MYIHHCASPVESESDNHLILTQFDLFMTFKFGISDGDGFHQQLAIFKEKNDILQQIF